MSREQDDETHPLTIIVDGDNKKARQAAFARISPALGAPVSSQPNSNDKIAAVVGFYWAVSLSVVFLNKHIMSSSEFRFPFPIMVTFYQLIVALGLLLVCGHLGKSNATLSIIPPFEFNRHLAVKVVPLTMIYVAMLAFNNLCLNYVEVTFYQVARSLTILFNIAFTKYFLGKSTSTPALVACGIVFMGFLLGSAGELNFSWIGLFFGVGSSFFVALYGIYVKKTLAYMDDNQWKLLHYNTALSIPLTFPLMFLFGEWSSAMKTVTFWSEFSFWAVMTVTGITGFLINIAVFLQIKVTTPLTNTISGTAKACAQTILAWFIWKNPISSLNGFGIFLSLFGSGLYSYVRYMEMKK
eukprot:Partr_v1_DN26276_c1_g4_i1_m48411 putative Solute carrier family 35 member C1